MGTITNLWILHYNKIYALGLGHGGVKGSQSDNIHTTIIVVVCEFRLIIVKWSQSHLSCLSELVEEEIVKFLIF